MLSPNPLLSVDDMWVEYRAGRERFAAVLGVSLAVDKGETLGVVGESGCGKSSVGRAILQLPKPDRGRVVFDGHELTSLAPREMQRLRRSLQIIFQDPIASLNPRRRIRDIVAEPLRIAGLRDKAEIDRRVRAALEAVGIDPASALDRRPHQFSGGQCQRICIARALVSEPQLVICDEPVASLDVSVQAQILNLLEDMKARFGLTLIFISHDLAVVKNISDRVAVMYLGRICEVADSVRIYARPAHPYTDALIATIPSVEPDVSPRAPLQGEIPSPLNPPRGCRFHTRCPRARPSCAETVPELREIEPGHSVACHFPLIGGTA